MVIIPFDKKIDWKHPPFVTLLLILTCSIVLVAVDTYHNRLFDALFDYYFASDLPRLELPLYADYLEKAGEEIDSEAVQTLVEETYWTLESDAKNELRHLLLYMQSDKLFMAKLRNGEIVTPENTPDFPDWQAQRKLAEPLIFKSVDLAYGFIPAEHRPITFFTSMFLHAGFGHLFGNMVMLLLVGFAVEIALGSMVYLVCYLLSGLASVSFFWALDPTSTVPLVGASGAIAGVMGMYAAVFGWRKIRFFYSLLFYFDYVKAPALIMLPAWLANEVYQMNAMPESNVAFTAHIGGLLAGGTIVWTLQRLFSGTIDTEYLDQPLRDEQKQQRLRRAIQHMGRLEIAKAHQLLRELHDEYPNDREIFWQLYKTLKNMPNSGDFQRILGQTLMLTDYDTQTLKLQSEAYGYYAKLPPGTVRLEPDCLPQLAIRFAKRGFPEYAEPIILDLLREQHLKAGLDRALYALAAAWKQRAEPNKCRQAVALLQKHFPASLTLPT